MSEQARYWVEGFLNGTEPDPSVNKDGDVDFENQEYRIWTQAVDLFHETGYWTDEERKCEKCGSALLQSEPIEVCRNCLSKN
ncbi:MAG: hypothetical protein K8R86_03360 [Bacteroidales bacterium]|nr:hypothetical protein [Bacteroidales bacterium]